MIDVHIHVDAANLPGMKPIPGGPTTLPPLPEQAQALREEMAGAGIKVAFGMPRYGAPADDPLGINATLRMMTLVPGLRAIGLADPTRTKAAHLNAVEEQIVATRGKLVALKAYLGYLPFGPDHPNYAPYYHLARKHGLPVIFHTGDNWSTKARLKLAHPLGVDDVAVEWPDVRFVMAHLGNPWLIDAAEVIFKNDNVWADLSGLLVGTEETLGPLIGAAELPDAIPGLVVADVRRALIYADRYDRLLYGTDWPLAPMRSYRRLIERIVPEKHHEAVFRTNAETVFALRA
jgi:predicted TIM-barrel fold metal-dependent hydrolase